jgi:hypothetical protein
MGALVLLKRLQGVDVGEESMGVLDVKGMLYSSCVQAPALAATAATVGKQSSRQNECQKVRVASVTRLLLSI